jgi:hypothetical protein
VSLGGERPQRRWRRKKLPHVASRPMWRWWNSLPLGTRLYFAFWTALIPAGVALLLVGAVVPGLVLLACFVFDQAVVTPLLMARSQRQRRANR